MAGNHKRRKRYIPKRIDYDIPGLAISGAATLMADQRAQLLTPITTAFEAFRAGKGTPEGWAALADAMNVAEALADRNIANDHIDTFAAAHRAIAAVHARSGQPGGSYTLYPAEICALDDAIFTHRIQLDHCSQTEMRESVRQVIRRVQGALAGNEPQGAMVCLPGLLGRNPELRA